MNDSRWRGAPVATSLPWQIAEKMKEGENGNCMLYRLFRDLPLFLLAGVGAVSVVLAILFVFQVFTGRP